MTAISIFDAVRLLTGTTNRRAFIIRVDLGCHGAKAAIGRMTILGKIAQAQLLATGCVVIQEDTDPATNEPLTFPETGEPLFDHQFRQVHLVTQKTRKFRMEAIKLAGGKEVCASLNGGWAESEYRYRDKKTFR